MAGGHDLPAGELDAAAHALSPCGGGTQAVGAQIDLAGRNDGAAVYGKERMTRRIAGLDRLGRGVVAGRRVLLIAIGNDLLRHRWRNDGQCEGQCRVQAATRMR